MGPFVAATGWAGSIFNFALPLYFMIATGSLAYAVIGNLIARDAAGLASDLGRTIIGIGVGYEVLINAVIIGNALFNTFTTIAIAASGFPAAAVSPDGLMTTGAVMVATLMSAVGWGTWLIHTTRPQCIIGTQKHDILNITRTCGLPVAVSSHDTACCVLRLSSFAPSVRNCPLGPTKR